MKTLKGRLKSIMRKEVPYEHFQKCIHRANDIIMVGSYLLRSYLIHLSENYQPFPSISERLIGNAFKVISKKSNGPKSKDAALLNSLRDHYFSKIVPILHPNWDPLIGDSEEVKYSAKNLSYVLKNARAMMITSFEEHVKRNFDNKVRQYVNQTFKEEHEKIVENHDGNKDEKKRELKFELKKVKEALLENNNDYPQKYEKWVTSVKSTLLPTKYKKCISYDAQKRPLNYLSVLMALNRQLESKKLKTFQSIPLRTQTYNQYVTIDTQALLDIFPFENKKKYLGQLRKHQDDLWEVVFDLKKFKCNGHTFNHCISTDGFAVSISFISPKEKELKSVKLTRMISKNKEIMAEMKDKSWEDRQKAKQIRDEAKFQKKLDADEIHAVQLKKNRDAFNKLPKEKKKELMLKNRLSKDINYVSDLVQIEESKQELQKAADEKRLVYVDPGKKTIATMMKHNGDRLNYNCRNRLFETKRLKYRSLVQNKKRKTVGSQTGLTIQQLETLLGETSTGKAVTQELFLKYAQQRLQLRAYLNKNTDYHAYLQKLNWFSYINRKRHDDNVLNRIEKRFGEDAVFVYGDWSGKGCAKGISTPGIGFRRRLQQRFTVHLIDEYNTSKISYLTQGECKNWKRKINGEDLKLHSVLTFKTASQRLGCINRDANAVLNMRIIMNSLLETGERPKAYRRGRKKLTVKTTPTIEPGDPNLGAEPQDALRSTSRSV